MAQFARFTCRREELPSIEAALAANGFVAENPQQRTFGRDTLLVMISGETIVLLAHSEPCDLATVEIWGPSWRITADMLHMLPLDLSLQRISSVDGRLGSEPGLGPRVGDFGL